jgi:hypothetical protein
MTAIFASQLCRHHIHCPCARGVENLRPFTQQYTWQEPVELYNLTYELIPNIRPNYNVAPTQDIGVVVPEGGGRIYEIMC